VSPGRLTRTQGTLAVKGLCVGRDKDRGSEPYGSFDDYLAAFRSKRRQKVRGGRDL
jgi:predicted N-acyltransferase